MPPELFDIIRNATITLPAFEIVIFLVIMTFCLMTEHTHLGLVVSFLAVYRWGWIVFESHSQLFQNIYIGFGILVALLAILDFSRYAKKK